VFRAISSGCTCDSLRTCMTLSSINPATGQLLATFETLAPADVAAALDRAATAFRSWRETPFEERARLLMRAADMLDAESEQFGRLMTLASSACTGSASSST